MAGVTKKQVKTILKTVIDPELGINIVDLGLIYEVKLKFQNSKLKNIYIKMTLTTPGCPLGGWFVEQVREAVATGLNIEPEQVMVEIAFDPPWTQEMMTEEASGQLGF